MFTSWWGTRTPAVSVCRGRVAVQRHVRGHRRQALRRQLEAGAAPVRQLRHDFFDHLLRSSQLDATPHAPCSLLDLLIYLIHVFRVLESLNSKIHPGVVITLEPLPGLRAGQSQMPSAQHKMILTKPQQKGHWPIPDEFWPNTLEHQIPARNVRGGFDFIL